MYSCACDVVFKSINRCLNTIAIESCDARVTIVSEGWVEFTWYNKEVFPRTSGFHFVCFLHLPSVFWFGWIINSPLSSSSGSQIDNFIYWLVPLTLAPYSADLPIRLTLLISGLCAISAPSTLNHLQSLSLCQKCGSGCHFRIGIS